MEITPTAGNHYFLGETPSEEPPNKTNFTEARMFIEHCGVAYIGSVEQKVSSPRTRFQYAAPERKLDRECTPQAMKQK